MRTPATRSLACAALAALTLVVPAAGQSVTVDVVVDRASQYVTAFVGRFSHVVAEERYVQDSRSSFPVVVRPAQHRELVADFLLVKTDEMTGWMPFRDVFEVNRVAVRDRDGRLAKLFLESPDSALTRAETIAQESARYNIGPRRTINNPVLSLAFLQDAYRPRFTFSIKGQDRTDGIETRVVEYQESGRPTIIRGASDRDIPASGRYWIDERTGNILKAELRVSDVSQTAKIVVTYRFDDRFQVCVPLQMEEEYILKNGMTVEATARYGRFRRFDVKTDETIR